MKTGAKRGQTSLPARPASTKTKKPRVGAVIAGAYPLYVFTGGIAAVDPGRRRAELVLQTSGSMLAAARHGEILAVVDALPPSAAFPKGASEWTIVDFGTSQILGQTQIAGHQLGAMGIRAKGLALTAWLHREGKGKTVELTAVVRTATGKPVSKAGAMRVQVKPIAAAARKRGGQQLASAPLFSSTEAVLTSNPPVRATVEEVATRPPAGAGVAHYPMKNSGIAAVVGLRDKGPHFAWFHDKKSGTVLRPVRCVATTTRDTGVKKPATTNKSGGRSGQRGAKK